jgi:O-antigen/teichoic acid export membrane protein
LFATGLKNITKNTFLKKFLVLTSGTALGQMIVIASTPLITRIYSPESMGTLSVLVSIITIISVVSSLRYETSIPLITDTNKLRNIILFSGFSIILISILSIVVLWLLTFYTENNALISYWYIIPIGVILTGFYQLLTFMSVRENLFKDLALTKFQQSIGQVLIQLAGFFLSGNVFLLIGGALVGKFLGLNKLVKKNINILKALFYSYSYKSMLADLKEYKKFPIYNAPSAFINSIGVNLLPILILTYFGPVNAGMYALSNRIIYAPMQLLGKNLSQVFLNESSSLLTNLTKLKRLYIKTISRLFIVGLILLVLLQVFIHFFFTFIFGDEWALSGDILQILGVMFVFQFSIIPLSEVFSVLNRQELRLIWDVIRLLSTICSFYISSMLNFAFLETIILYSIIMIIMYIFLWIMSLFAFKYNKIIKEE